MSTLVIVESPAKARTISQYLGKDYIVEASYGHVRDLPQGAEEIPESVKKEKWSRLGVNVENDFEPLYIVPKDKKKQIKILKDALKKVDEVLLATDEDREGESISWHVIEVLKPKVPVRRIVFHEITEEAIKKAIASPREIDDNLVRAQESRRIVDRLFGYELSPVLWRKVRTGLSAGRVQSVAVRLCVLRERERRAFNAARYWDVEAELSVDGQSFTAKLRRVGDEKIASGQDFDADNGELLPNSKALWLKTEEEVQALVDGWESPWKAVSVEEKPFKNRPAAPFTTSSMQQEANRKLRFTARNTMRIAQRLYEGIEVGGERFGLITYMRTDSVTLSNKALGDAATLIRSKYGDAYTDGPREYKTKAKGAQEAHEAIRPTELSRTPEEMKSFLEPDELKLYELIWKRTIASQMTDARLKRTSVRILASGTGPDGTFAASGKTIEFPGFLRAYVEGSDDPNADIADKEIILPAITEGAELAPLGVETLSHDTSPPARYTEASLVKKLEQEGIGRPSTYASIIDTIQRRGYVRKQGNALTPTFTAHAVTLLLERHFVDYVETEFTARMEQQLDDIAGGNRDWKEHLKHFYFGGGSDQKPGLETRISTEVPDIDYPRMEIGEHPETGSPIVVRVGRYGPYLQYETKDGEKIVASLPDELAPAELDAAYAVKLLAKAEKGADDLGIDPATGLTVYLANGRFGPYVQLGETPERGSKDPKPKRASIPKDMSEDDVTLELALKWLSLPRTLGTDPENDNEEVVAASGRFGPYIKCGKETRSLPKDEDIYTVTYERAIELLRQPKVRRGAAARTVLKDFGKDADGNQLELLDGRYGPYLTNGELNASVPKGTDAMTMTPEAAQQLLAERGKAPKRGRKKKAAKKKTAKKKATKKKATKKKAAKKATKKKAAKKKTSTSDAS